MRSTHPRTASTSHSNEGSVSEGVEPHHPACPVHSGEGWSTVAPGLSRSIKTALCLFTVFLFAACGGGGATTGSGGGGGGGGGGNGGGGNGGGGTRGGGTGTGVVNSFFVVNDSDVVRNETIEASVPFARGQFTSLDRVGVKGLATAWRVLQRWDDGSVKVAQAQFTDEVPASSKKVYEVVKDVSTLTGGFQQNSWVANMMYNFLCKVEVTDTFGVKYSADLSGATPVTVQESFLIRERRWRVYLRNANPQAGIKRDFLAARVYMKEYRDTPFIKLKVVVANDYLGADNPAGSTDPNLYPLGPVSFKTAVVTIRGAWNRMQFLKEQGYPAHVYDGATDLDHYTVMSNTWLDDGQTKLFTFDLFFDYWNGVKSARDKWMAIYRAMEKMPLRPLASLKSWQSTKALGINGGPVTGPTNAYDRAEKELAQWRSRDQFGIWGTWGDPKGSGTTGTPRNAPMSQQLGHAIQGENPKLLEVLEGMAMQQAVRQYHMWGLKVGDEDDLYLWNGVPYTKNGRKLSNENLGRYAMWQSDPYAGYRSGVDFGFGRSGHGWNAYDNEHWSSDLLFDYYTVTGDCWALDELKMMGQCLKGLMRLKHFFTKRIQSARAEGWTLTSFIQIWFATGDNDYKNYALRRINEIVEPQRWKNHPAKALTWQWDHPLTKYPVSTAFYMPWQHGPVILAYSAAHKYWGSTVAKQISEDAVTAVEYAWVKNFKNDPKWGTIVDGLRYYVPVLHNQKEIPANYFDTTSGIGGRWGDSPLGGAHQFLLSGLYLVADRSSDNAFRTKAIYFADKLLGTVGADRGRLWDKWALATPDHMLPSSK